MSDPAQSLKTTVRHVLDRTGLLGPLRSLRNAGVSWHETEGQSATRQFVKWAHRVLLHRAVESPQAVDRLIAANATEADVVLQLLKSSAFGRGSVAQRLVEDGWHPRAAGQSAALADLLARFNRYRGPNEPGFYTDYFGTRTRTRYVPGMRQYDNRTLGSPVEEPVLFDAAEWEGTLRSLLEARERVVAIELGAGWGPWLATCFAAARQRGITDIALAGVEGSDGHYAYLVQHLTDNGVDPGKHFLFKGVVGTADGFAYFPRLAKPEEDWGAQAVLTAAPSQSSSGDFTDYRGLRFDAMDKVPSIALNTLIRRYSRVDIIHCDIQDSEGDVLPGAFDELDKRVRRIVVGTHSRKSEGALLAAFSAGGWVLEADTPCRYVVENKRTVLVQDGVQVWANPGLAPH